MNLSSYNTVEGSEEGAFLHLKHPATGEFLYDTSKTADNKVGIYLRGVDSKNFRARLQRQANKLLKATTFSGRRGNSGMDDITAESLDIEATDRAVACFISAENAEITVQGSVKPVKTAEDFRILLEQCPWVRDQVDNFVGERGNFLPKASKP